MIKYFYDKIWKKSKGGYTTHSPNRERVKLGYFNFKITSQPWLISIIDAKSENFS
jgi:hypothetical protein